MKVTKIPGVLIASVNLAALAPGSGRGSWRGFDRSDGALFQDHQMKFQTASVALANTVILASLLLTSPLQAKEPVPAYRDKNAPMNVRVEDLLSRMSLEEKVAQLQSNGHGIAIVKDGRINEPIAHRILSQGAGTYVLREIETENVVDRAREQNAVQRWVMKNTRLGIPIAVSPTYGF